MKHLMMMVVLLLAFSAQAQTTLRIPLFIQDIEVDEVPAAVMNERFKKAGAPLIPEYVEITSAREGVEVFDALDKKIQASLEILGGDYAYLSRSRELVPASRKTAKLETCYTGNPLKVMDLVRSLPDLAYTEQLNAFAFKHKGTIGFSDDMDEEFADPAIYNGESKVWKNWNTQSDDVLVLSAHSDGGDDVNDSIIPRCK